MLDQQNKGDIILDQKESQNSSLGKKEYWDQFYKEEVDNFKSHQLEGQIWFGRSVQKTLVSYIVQNINQNSKTLDVGCGNCQLLIALAKTGYTDLTGCDYSNFSIELSDNILKQPQLSQLPKIELVQCDILNDVPIGFVGAFDFIHDKGTFDVIYLNTGIENSLYPDAIYKMLQKSDSSRFLITSCNTTYDELNQIFTKAGKFVQIEKVKGYKTLKFGGSTGQTVTSILFKPVFF